MHFLLLQYRFLIVLFFINAFAFSIPCLGINGVSESAKDSLADYLNESKNKKLDRQKRISYLKKAYSLSQHEENDSLKNTLLLDIANQARILNDSTFFITLNSSLIQKFNTTNNDFGLAYAHYYFGVFYLKYEQLETSFFHFNQAKDNFIKLEDTEQVGVMWYNIAIIQKDVNDFTGSEIAVINALAIFEQLNKKEYLYYCYNLLSTNYNELDEFEKAIASNDKALKIIQSIDSNSNLSEITMNNLGMVYQESGNYQKSIEFFNKVIQNSNLRERNINRFARVIDNLTYSKFLLGDTLGNYADFILALKIRDSINNPSGVILSKLHLAEYFAYKHDTAIAVQYTKEAKALAKEVQNHRDHLAALELLAKLEPTNSGTHLETYIQLNDSLQTEERKIRNKFTRIQYETDQYIAQTEALTNKNFIITVSSIAGLAIMLMLFIIRIQRSKNKALKLERLQQQANEEIYKLMLEQNKKLENGRALERDRIAKELHDGIINKLFGVRMGLSFLELNIDDKTKEEHKIFTTHLQDLEKEIRDLSHDLVNEEQYADDNFLSLVQNMINEQTIGQHYLVELNSKNFINWSGVDVLIRMNVYRILQESLQNISKHAKASKVEILFASEEHMLQLSVIDNGIGFDKTKVKYGIGIKNIRSRVEQLNGEVTIQSDKNGTVIFIQIPLNLPAI